KRFLNKTYLIILFFLTRLTKRNKISIGTLFRSVDKLSDNMRMFLIIPSIIIITYIFVQYIRNKMYRPKYEGNVQKPGTLEGFITKLFVFLTVFAVFFTFVGVFAKESEMALVFCCIAIFFFLITLLLKYGQDMS